jgi:hypothetical protein
MRWLPKAEVCREVTSDLREIAGWFSGGGMTPEQFCRSVAVFEAAKLERLGFRLGSGVTKDGKAHFSLWEARSGTLCARMEVDPVTGAFGESRRDEE